VPFSLEKLLTSIVHTKVFIFITQNSYRRQLVIYLYHTQNYELTAIVYICIISVLEIYYMITSPATWLLNWCMSVSG